MNTAIPISAPRFCSFGDDFPIPVHPIIRCFDLADHEFFWTHSSNLTPYVFDKTLRDKLVQSMKSMIASSEDETMADGSSSSSSASPRPAVRPPRRKTPPTTITTSREMDDPGAIGTDVPKPPKPDPTRSDDFFEDV